MVRNGGVFPRSFSELRLLRQQYRAILESTWPACTAAFPHSAGALSTGGGCDSGGEMGGEEGHVDGDGATGHGNGHGGGRGRGERPCQSAGEGGGAGAKGGRSRSPTAAYAHPFSPSALRSLAYVSPAVLRAWVHRGSYRLVEAFVGAGVLDITNQFRTRTLHLDPLFLTDRPFSHLLRLPIPFSFSWSPLLAPKPSAREASAVPPPTPPSSSPSEARTLESAPLPESPTLPASEEEAARPAAAAAVAAAGGEAGEKEEQGECKPAPPSDPLPPSPPSFHPPPALVSFLAEGPAPLFVAYGSMQLSKPCYVARCVLKAVGLLGVRAIIGSAAIRQHRCCSSSHCLAAGGRTRRGGKGRAGVGGRVEEGGGKREGKGRQGKHAERNVAGREAGGSVEGGGTQGGAEEGGGGGEGEGEGECEVVQQGGVLFVGSVAHDWLFPHCSATVHHGGAGTVAASIRAGCPILPMPFFGDQHFWAAVLHSLGVAPPALPIHRISPRRLLSSLRLLLQPALKARAMQLKNSFLLEYVPPLLSNTAPLPALSAALCNPRFQRLPSFPTYLSMQPQRRQ
ncbi:unnamed protein product [Closterium sp. NIES-64]|nr:unnamed protein product [Closterium sp. NIES-64]